MRSVGPLKSSSRCGRPSIPARTCSLWRPQGRVKTLCAFLSALDRLMAAGRVPQEWMFMAKSRQPRAMRNKKLQGKAPARKRSVASKVLYISPLKALGADVAKNLELPLQGISQQYEAMELPIPPMSKWPCAAATPHLNNVEESSAIRRIFSSPRRNHYSCCSPPRRTAY